MLGKKWLMKMINAYRVPLLPLESSTKHLDIFAKKQLLYLFCIDAWCWILSTCLFMLIVLNFVKLHWSTSNWVKKCWKSWICWNILKNVSVFSGVSYRSLWEEVVNCNPHSSNFHQFLHESFSRVRNTLKFLS